MIASAPQLHLASASPRRRELLRALGLRFTFGGVDIDESAMPGEAPQATAVRLATQKALAAVERRLPVLAADTVVCCDGRAFGKPSSAADALDMLTALSGRSHEVTTAVALRVGNLLDTAISTSAVRFRDIGPDEARAYWQSGEPAGKAGGYAIQGIGGIFAASVTGSYTGVVGLPIFETAGLLARHGIRILPTLETP